LATEPEGLICDEAASAVAVSIRARIVDRLAQLPNSLGLALLFIRHKLAVVEQVTQPVAAMYLDRIVETAARPKLFGAAAASLYAGPPVGGAHP
jgi:peptide/nickel transport system ATP-binding protein